MDHIVISGLLLSEVPSISLITAAEILEYLEES